MRTLLIAGATGLVGSHVLRQAIASNRFDWIVAPTRRPMPYQDRLVNPVIDFDHLPYEAEWWAADSFISTLGSTGASAGSQEALTRAEHDYPLAMATVVRRHGGRSLAVCSAQGASLRSPFHYFKIKAALEESLKQLAFPSITIVRPGLIGGRQPPRPGERMALSLLRVLEPVLPRRIWVNPASAIARTLLDPLLMESPGVHVVRADRLIGTRAERKRVG
jgi:uncharacterized protein YbjT (DUF2867 family)